MIDEETIEMIFELVKTLDYLDLTALQNAIESRRYNMRKAKEADFKSFEII